MHFVNRLINCVKCSDNHVYNKATPKHETMVHPTSRGRAPSKNYVVDRQSLGSNDFNYCFISLN